MHFKCNQKIDSFILFKLMKNFRGSALAAGVGTPESAPHELLGSSLHFYLRFKHRNCFGISYKYSKINPSSLARRIHLPQGGGRARMFGFPARSTPRSSATPRSPDIRRPRRRGCRREILQPRRIGRESNRASSFLITPLFFVTLCDFMLNH